MSPVSPKYLKCTVSLDPLTALPVLAVSYLSLKGLGVFINIGQQFRSLGHKFGALRQFFGTSGQVFRDNRDKLGTSSQALVSAKLDNFAVIRKT